MPVVVRAETSQDWGAQLVCVFTVDKTQLTNARAGRAGVLFLYRIKEKIGRDLFLGRN